MKRYIWMVACMIVSLAMTNLATAAGKPGAGARPSASRPAPARMGGAHASPARPNNVHSGGSHVGPGHAKTAPAPVGPTHAKAAAAGNTHANAAKPNQQQTTGGKKAAPSGNGKSGAAPSRNFPGRGYRGFSGSTWLPDFSVNAFYNPDDTTWYYWYEPSDLFLPVSYLNDYPPAGTTGTNNNLRPNVPSPLDGSLLPRE